MELIILFFFKLIIQNKDNNIFIFYYIQIQNLKKLEFLLILNIIFIIEILFSNILSLFFEFNIFPDLIKLIRIITKITFFIQNEIIAIATSDNPDDFEL